ncbi:TIR domain-containing protein [Candidatus Gracilibacteria bacterium]|nr:TIR domain-containing protein [Candidatus Gracilibacteria bacterium]
MAREAGASLLTLEDDDGYTQQVSGARLVSALKQLDPAQLPLLVLFAACHSAGDSHRPEALAALGPELARAGVLAVLAMQGRAPVAMLRELMPTFFRELLRDGQIDRALAVARARLDDAAPWWIPVLYMRLSSGQLWPPPSKQTLQLKTSRPAQVFISYKRNVERDEMLAQQLFAELADAGHTPYFDQLIPVGARWRDELEHQIAASDMLIVLLSEHSVTSQAVAQELELAARVYQRSGKARVLPVRVAYHADLPYQLRRYLDELQYVAWDAPADTPYVVARLLQAIEQRQQLPPLPAHPFLPADPAQPQPFADPRSIIDEDFIATLADPSGAVKRSDPFYIERASDIELRRALLKRDGKTITIRAGRQTGKTSLLMRAMQQLKEAGTTCVFVDLQAAGDETLANGESFLRYLALHLVKALRLDVQQIDRFWQQDMFTVQDRMNDLLNDYVLVEARTRIALCIDEADRLLRRSYADNFFGLLRSWHNRRVSDDEWERLDLLLVISTEPSLLIKDATQSPFNVGTRLRLADFNAQQVSELNQRYRAPLTDAQVLELLDFLGGHPYLTRRALHTLVTGTASWDQLITRGIHPDSPFHDHLKYYYLLVSDDNDLRDDLVAILTSGECAHEIAYNRLFSAGLLRAGDRHHCTFRSRLYEEFFRDKLDELTG